MKQLWKSKRFRKNLYRWLFMYVGVMLLFTSVVTYSKYISTLQSSDAARMPTFDVKIAMQEKCDDEETTCNTGTFRPTSEITYQFEAKTNLEVKTEVFYTIMINNRFHFLGLTDITDGTLVPVTDFTSSDVSKDIVTGSSSESYKTYTWKVSYDAGSEEIKKYQVKVQFDNLYCPSGQVDCNKDKENYQNISKTAYDILRIGYSAIQLND